MQTGWSGPLTPRAVMHSAKRSGLGIMCGRSARQKRDKPPSVQTPLSPLSPPLRMTPHAPELASATTSISKRLAPAMCLSRNSCCASRDLSRCQLPSRNTTWLLPPRENPRSQPSASVARTRPKPHLLFSSSAGVASGGSFNFMLLDELRAPVSSKIQFSGKDGNRPLQRTPHLLAMGSGPRGPRLLA
eukprot:scaffold1804_cov263-Pinguiococcus_pyrenoidosus.AAC.26